jgi:hypothetical protein
MCEGIMLDVNVAAVLLLKQLALPASAAVVWPWREEGEVVLHAVIDPGYRGVLPDVPSRFCGFRVSLEARTPNVGL